MTVNQDKRDRPYPYINKAIDLLKSQGMNRVIEIGCVRGPLNHPVHEYHHMCCNDGHSTALFAAAGLETISVDINPVSIEYANEILSRISSKPYHTYCTDGIAYLKNYSKSIELLYLDAWDVGTEGSAENHLIAYNTVKNLMVSGSIILIDDTDVDYDGTDLFLADSLPSGKGKLLYPQAIKDGFEEIFRGRQTLLRKP